MPLRSPGLLCQLMSPSAVGAYPSGEPIFRGLRFRAILSSGCQRVLDVCAHPATEKG